MPEYIVDVSEVNSWPKLVAAFNAGLIRKVGGNWNGGLDALNDYLSWPEHDRYRLVLKGWHACANALGEHTMGDGRRVLDILAEIFQDNPHVTVVFT
jgi:hypothetical protein